MAKGAAGSSVFKRNVSWQFVGTASQVLLSGLVLLLLGRELDAEGFGQFSIITGYVLVANLLVEPRMQDVAARQFWNLDRYDAVGMGRQRSFFVDFLLLEATLKLVPCIALISLSGWLASVGQLASGSALLIALAAVGTYVGKLGFGLSMGVHRVLGRSDHLTYCATGEVLLRLLILLALAWLSRLTIATAVITQCLTAIVSNAAQLALAIRNLHGLGDALHSWQRRGFVGRLRTYGRTLLSNIGLSISDLMNKDLDVTLLAPMVPSADVGVYKMAKNIALLAWRAVDPFYIALMPELNRLVGRRDYRTTSRLLLQSTAGLAVLAVVASLSTYTAVYLLTERLLGAAYVEMPTLLGCMTVAITLSAPLVWSHPFAVALDRSHLAFVGFLSGSVLGVGALVVLVPVVGVYGAAVAWSLALASGFWLTAGASLRAFSRYKMRHVEHAT